MGRIRQKSSIQSDNKSFNDTFFSTIHRARVTDVHVSTGLLSVSFDDTLYSRDDVLMPLFGLSYPPRTYSSGTTETAESPEEQTEADTRAYATSWGRYIPQKGDMILVGFDPTGKVYALGYHAVSYGAFDYQDALRADTGGIGWGESSGKTLKEGDWDFKSSRGCYLYMGDRAKLSSGPHSILLDQNSGDILTTSGLVQDSCGEASNRREGDAKRQLLPTDGTETYIFSIIPGNNTKTAQESLDVVKYATLAGVEVELSRIHHGEVIDETTKTPMVPALNASLAPLALLTGTGVRMLHSVKDPKGTTDYYISAVDDLGNYGVSAPLATGFVWSTPLAVWQITSLSTTHTCAGTYSLTANSLSMTSTTSLALSGATLTAVGSTSVSLTAPTIAALGTVSLGATGGSPVLKADPAFAAAWSTYFTGAAAAWTALNTLMPNPAFTAAGAAATALAALCQPTTMVTAM